MKQSVFTMEPYKRDSNYADYANIQYYMKINSITDYANYADFQYQ